MNYGELKDVFQELNTGTNIFNSVNYITEMVLNEMAARRIRRKTTTILNPTGLTEFVLATHIPDYVDVVDNKSIYAVDTTAQNTSYYIKVNNRKFQQEFRRGVSTVIDGKLKIQTFGDSVAPNPLKVDHFSRYLVANNSGVEKSKPENTDDVFLINSVFEGALVEGLLLYSSRKERDSDEFLKARQAWLETLSSAIYLTP